LLSTLPGQGYWRGRCPEAAHTEGPGGGTGGPGGGTGGKGGKGGSIQAGAFGVSLAADGSGPAGAAVNFAAVEGLQAGAFGVSLAGAFGVSLAGAFGVSLAAASAWATSARCVVYCITRRP
jgi:hypothetical protein